MKSFLTGLATGLAIGYLTAPHSGKETRDQLTENANKQKKGLKERWDKTVSKAKQLAEDVKTNPGSAEPNLFAEMESGKMDKYLDEAAIARRKAKAGLND
jgi:gas vesicle protein